MCKDKMDSVHSCQTLDDCVAGEITGGITSEFLNDLRTIRRESILSGNVSDFKYLLPAGMGLGAVVAKVGDYFALPDFNVAVIGLSVGATFIMNIVEHLKYKGYHHWYHTPGQLLGAVGGTALGYAAAEYLSRLMQ